VLSGQRRMKNESSEDYVSYELFKNRAGTDRFGDAVVAERVSGIGRGIHILSIPVYGQLIGTQIGTPAGLYTDNAVITVYF
jgi:spore coat protein U-like protein